MNLLDFINQIREIPTIYYLLRDRAPFFLTLVWVYRHKLSTNIRDLLGKCFFGFICMVWVGSLYLTATDRSLTYLYGIKWSHPAPVEWGLFIIGIYLYITKKGVEPFTSIYFGVITVTGAGWLYETRTWIKNRDFVKLLGANYHKVFFIDFQVISMLIFFFLLKYSREINYKTPPNLGLLTGVYGAYQFLLSSVVSITFYKITHQTILWTWFIRVPTILYLAYIITGVQEKH